MAKQFSLPKIIVLVVNVGIVVYLIARLRKGRTAPEPSQVPVQSSFQ
jgi:uncharacterized membrane protein (DUF2068 family)